MEYISGLFRGTFTEALGWTLFHALWQGVLLLVLLSLLLVLLRNYSAALRHGIAYGLLLLFLVTGGITFHLSHRNAIVKQELANAVSNDPGILKKMFSEQISSGDPSVGEKFSGSKEWLLFRARVQRAFPFIFFFWLMGVVFLMLRMGIGMWQILHMRSTGEPVGSESWNKQLIALQNKMGIRRLVRLLRTTQMRVPSVTGMFRPVILVPVSLITGLNNKEVEAVLAHELAHIRRNDYLLNIIQSVVEVLFFYHPAIWYTGKIIRTEREHACDELVVAITGDRLSLIKALAGSLEASRNPAHPYALAFAGKGPGILQRVKHIQNHTTMKSSVQGGFIATTIVFISLVLLSFTFDGNQLKRPGYHTGNSSRISTANQADTVKTLKQDSIEVVLVKHLDSLHQHPEDLEKLIEVAVTEHDEDLSLLILESMEAAMAAIDMEMIMREVDSAMKTIDYEIMIHEATAETHEEIRAESLAMAAAGLEEARRALEDLDLDLIITSALEDAAEAMQHIDIEVIVEDAMEAANEAMHQAAREQHVTIRREMEAEREEMEKDREEMEKESQSLEEERIIKMQEDLEQLEEE